MSTATKYRIVYFPLEQKYSIWDDSYNLIKEWFDSRGSAENWLRENIKDAILY